jgi:vesicle coat complex subunit
MTANTINQNSRLSSFNSEKLSFRLPRWQKDIVDFISVKERLNQTDVIRNSINNYFLACYSSNKGALKQQTREKYVQMDLLEWAATNENQIIENYSPSWDDIDNATVVYIEEMSSLNSTEKDPFLDFYYGKQ